MTHHAHTHPSIATSGPPPHGIATTERELNRLSVSATLHCMTGCVIGEVLGLVIATYLGWSTAPSIALAVGLAFFFGYLLTSIPLLRAGVALGAVIPIALATDTFSIITMEVIENATMLLVPGAMHAYLDEALFWGPMIAGFVIAFPFAFLVNRALLRRGRGHALVHKYHQH